MLDEVTYREWTSPFNPTGSTYIGSWEKGSTIKFVDKEGGTGMLAEIAENRPHEFVSIKHIGLIQNGVEDTTSDEVKKWTPAFENYTFTPKDGGTELFVEIDTNEEYADMFNGMWPKALEKLKEISERA